MSPTRKRIAVALAAVLIAGAITGLAFAKSSKSAPTIKTAHNATVGKTIVVDSKGLTVYELSPETTHHLLCTKASGCFGFWPPVTVKSAHTKLRAGKGVKGKLAILHRNGLFQVTLSGHPLYRYAGDGSRKGRAAGQGIKTFGGTWHVVAVGSSSTAKAPSAPAPSMPSSGYGY